MHSFSDSNTSAKRPVAMSRTSSQQSAQRASPGGTTTTKLKQHRVSIGKAHARTPSYGKNLHKLTKIVNDNVDDGSTNPPAKKPISPTSPHTATLIRRNISAGNLVRQATKAPVRKNKSEVSLLLRHHQAAQHHHQHRSRPTTPTEKKDSQTKETNKAKYPKPKPKFELDENEDDGEWTEDSTSPVMTRRSSMSKDSRAQSRLGYSPPPIQEAVMQEDESEDISPGSPPDDQYDMLNLRQTARVQLLDRRESRDATAHPDVLASRLLSGNTLAGNITPVTSRHALVIPTGNGSTPYPSDGVNRFLATTNQTLVPSAGSSLSRSTMFESPAGDRNLPDAATGDNIRQSASVGNLIKKPLQVTQDSEETAKVPSYTFAFTGAGRYGAATQTKLNLWRSQTSVEPTGGHSTAMLGEAPIDLLNTDERRMMLWQNAEKELNAVRRFVNPVLESAKRASLKDKPYRHVSAAHSINGTGTAHTSYSTTPENRSNMPNGLARRTHEGSRPPSRAGSRAVRFEVGTGNELGRGTEHVEPVEDILRRLWNSNEGASVEG
ncbi:MAG: hypothetical protein GOMPHAMPRED_001522 [Gomphillus americanus]|uniref:Uncharacterized protein n=1 Tax=Gomphillus americanus TaxID=1940652 RepID=A0A8H3F7B9_9LECA|nr:MAG: hypothetical protein GOMPHAMPRED_001522 [Gomphillus americanus]